MKNFSLLQRALNMIAPKSCAVCGKRLAISEDLTCMNCNFILPRTEHYRSPADNELVRIFWGRVPNLKYGAAFMMHLPKSRSANIIYRLKYGNSPRTGHAIGRMMAQEYLPWRFFNEITALFPMPLSKNRLRQRGYNQSLEVARGISSITNLPIIEGAVKRRKFRSSQTSKSRTERNANVINDFKLVDKQKIENRHILIIDDIVTTGATVTALAAELSKADNVTISIMSIGISNRRVI